MPTPAARATSRIVLCRGTVSNLTFASGGFITFPRSLLEPLPRKFSTPLDDSVRRVTPLAAREIQGLEVVCAHRPREAYGPRCAKDCQVKFDSGISSLTGACRAAKVGNQFHGIGRLAYARTRKFLGLAGGVGHEQAHWH